MICICILSIKLTSTLYNYCTSTMMVNILDLVNFIYITNLIFIDITNLLILLTPRLLSLYGAAIKFHAPDVSPNLLANITMWMIPERNTLRKKGSCGIFFQIGENWRGVTPFPLYCFLWTIQFRKCPKWSLKTHFISDHSFIENNFGNNGWYTVSEYSQCENRYMTRTISGYQPFPIEDQNLFRVALWNTVGSNTLNGHQKENSF